ncbi:alpha/beta hydrolase [Aggregicoccus sp. 17bor-14]|uniref:alpha/beta hydrolase n=1 Tax=Myxococcaceae TaxID=31 RepID=UPI00129C5A23|nr:MULTISPECIES: alpha/beta hydrolase [Myxococcaceae]MBF5041091.1 alpha/beta hydrolase [Simulacricoccus sp. 17bor-14]MRI86878.1 alpha/beta hydrolase [Aggregicoccus sp. 17bor-14]
MDRGPTEAPFTRSEVHFASGAERCAAWLYRPTAKPGPLPCVVMAHGFTLTRNDALPRFAEAFAREGFAALLFDYRHFGDSEGEPRELLDIARQREDYRAALAYARTLPFVDAERLVLWGFSFSGGHVLAVGEQDADVAAVVSIAPFVNGLANLRITPLRVLLRAAGLAVLDGLRALFGRAPLYVPAVGEPGTFALLTSEEAMPGYASITSSADSRWVNRLAARLLLHVPFENPGGAAGRLGVPLFMAVANRDLTVPPEAAVRAAQRAPKLELRRYDTGHFEMYRRPDVLDDQLSFLRRRVLGILPPKSELLVEVELS